MHVVPNITWKRVQIKHIVGTYQIRVYNVLANPGTTVEVCSYRPFTSSRSAPSKLVQIDDVDPWKKCV